jgi:predicted DNA-binding protein with PD1-like motif
MKSKQLYEEHGLRTFLLVMDKGDEAFEQITTFAREHEVAAASLTAIGAATSATLGYFDPEILDYRWTRFDEQMEICSFIGDIASRDGEPALHAHMVLGRKDYTALAGHVQQVHVFPTMEVVLTETPAHLRKRVDPETGIALIALGESDGTG